METGPVQPNETQNKRVFQRSRFTDAKNLWLRIAEDAEIPLTYTA